MIPILNLQFLGSNIGFIQLIQIAFAGVSAVVAIFLSHLTWQQLVVSRVSKNSFTFLNYIRPLISYGFFIILFLSTSLIFYQFSNQLLAVSLVFQISIFILIGQYVYIISKSRILHVITLFVLSLMWYFNRISLLKPFLSYINKYSIKIGAFQITPSSFFKSTLIVLAFFWITSIISHQVTIRLKKIKKLSSNTKGILSKILDVVIYFVACLFVLNILGINLSTLTVIGGALGVGIGFGLQKITSNFISGIILLFEKSIQIDHLIEMDGGIYGFVRRLSSRYTLVETFDGQEIFIPNEDFITNRVTNWTYTNKTGRIQIKVGISYDSDIKLAKKIMLESAKEHPSCMVAPTPKCFLTNFGDNSLDYLLLFFVNDISVGPHEHKSKVMETIWDKFKEHNIDIPFPQRDVRIKSNKELI